MRGWAPRKAGGGGRYCLAREYRCWELCMKGGVMWDGVQGGVVWGGAGGAT